MLSMMKRLFLHAMYTTGTWCQDKCRLVQEMWIYELSFENLIIFRYNKALALYCSSSSSRRELDRWSLVSKQSSTSFSMCLFFRSACNYIKYFGGDENNNEEKEEEKEGTKNILHKTACDRVCPSNEKVSLIKFSKYLIHKIVW